MNNKLNQKVCNEFLKTTMVYVIPILHLIAAIINLFNAKIFASLEKPYNKTSIYRCLTANSIINAVYFFSIIASAYSLCSINLHQTFYVFQYWYILYQLYIVFYLTRVLGMISSLVNIQIAIYRCKISKNINVKNKFNKPIKRNMMYFVLISAIFYIPNIMFNKIYKIEPTFPINTTNTPIESKYSLFDLSFSYYMNFSVIAERHKQIKLVIVVLQIIATAIYLFIMITTNKNIYNNSKVSSGKKADFILTYVGLTRVKSFRIAVDEEDIGKISCFQKIKIKHKENHTKIMVIWITFEFIVDQILLAIGQTSVFLFERESQNHSTLQAITSLGRVICTLSNTIFYYFYNLQYRKNFKNIFKHFMRNKFNLDIL
jgi:hypothetical protein